MTAVPTRTCVGCRQRDSVRELVRLVLVDGKVSPTAGIGRTGRGASIHPREACVVAAARTHAFARAFRGAVSLGSGLSKSPLAADPSHKRNTVDDAVRALLNDIEVAHVLQQPRAGRTP